MPAFGPIKRQDLIAALRRLGFDGPFTGGRHEFMVRGGMVLTVPNPHGKDISRTLLRIILRQAGISRRVWETTRSRGHRAPRRSSPAAVPPEMTICAICGATV